MKLGTAVIPPSCRSMWPQFVDGPADVQDNTRNSEVSPHPLAGVEGSQDQAHGIVDQLVHAAADELARLAVEFDVDDPHILRGRLHVESLPVRHAVDLKGSVPVYGETDQGPSSSLAVGEVTAGKPCVHDEKMLRSRLPGPGQRGRAIDALERAAAARWHHGDVDEEYPQAVEALDDGRLIVLGDAGALTLAHGFVDAHAHEQGWAPDGGGAKAGLAYDVVARRAGGARGEESRGQQSEGELGPRASAHDEMLQHSTS